MHFRATLSLLLCLCALAVGILAVHVSSRNRARAHDLDATQRWCEVYSRQNDLLRAELRQQEWELVSGQDDEESAFDDSPLPMVER